MPATDSSPATSPPTRTRARAALVALALVLCGIVIGAVGDRMLLFRRHQGMLRGAFDPSTSRIVDHIANDLDLSASQRTVVAQIVKRHHDRVRAVWTTVRQEVHSEMDQAHSEINAVLSPQQREKFGRTMPHHHRSRFFHF